MKKFFITLLASILLILAPTKIIHADLNDYLNFTAINDTEISFNKSRNYNNAPIIYYSFDLTNWLQYTFDTPIFLKQNETIYWKGNNSTFNKNADDYINFTSTDLIEAHGNIMSLIDLTSTTIPCANCFYSLFKGCDTLLTVPELPATTLNSGCYSNMFKGCTGLTVLPSDLLPATTLATGCYYHMFDGCTGLTVIPENFLPATTLATTSYASMFANCSSLTTVACKIPANTMFASTCSYMFENCYKLQSLADGFISATKVSERCYYGMFSGCRALATISNLSFPALELATSCYELMFYGCYSIQGLPDDFLPATILAPSCYRGMFFGCSRITNVPKLPARQLADSCYKEMFRKCSGIYMFDLKDIPGYSKQFLIPASTTGASPTTPPNETLNMFAEAHSTVASPFGRVIYYMRG